MARRADDRSDEAAEDDVFEAPERGSADELLDAGAHSDLDAMRHSTAHVMAEAVLDLFPGTQLGIGPAIADGFYYDFKLPRPLTPDDLAAIEARMAASVAADHPFVRRELSPERGPGVLRGAQPAVQGRDPRRPRRQGEGRRDADAAASRLRARPVRRPVQGPARRVHRQDRAVQAPRRRRRVLARRREAADAPAHLRHGLGDAGGPRAVPLAPRRGEEARPSPARRPARPVQLPRRLPGLGLLASRRAS